MASLYGGRLALIRPASRQWSSKTVPLSQSTRSVTTDLRCWSSSAPNRRRRVNAAARPCVASARCGGTRPVSSSSSSSPNTDSLLPDYFEKHRIPENVRRGIVRALKAAYGREATIADLKDLGPSGLEALAASVAQDEERKGGLQAKERPFTKVHFTIPHHRTEFDLRWELGDSLLDVAKSVQGEELLGEYMGGTCGGQMSCCTCHVYLDEDVFDFLPEPCEAEEDMLSLAFDPRDTSRLGCQVVLTEEVLKAYPTENPITVTIPEDVNDVWQ